MLSTTSAGLWDPVQFNLFAFVPDNLGGEHPYLDATALHAQQIFVRSLVNRFRDIPFLAWDLINEPSANKNVWKTLPQNKAFENAAWQEWLEKRYPDRAALLDAWAEPSFGVGTQQNCLRRSRELHYNHTSRRHDCHVSSDAVHDRRRDRRAKEGCAGACLLPAYAGANAARKPAG